MEADGQYWQCLRPYMAISTQARVKDVCNLCFYMGQGCLMCCRLGSFTDALLKNNFI